MPICDTPTCGLCKILPNNKLDLIDTVIDKTQKEITLKKTVKNSDDTYSYPLSISDQYLIQDRCYSAVIRSCVKNGEGGDEAVTITNYDALKGIVTLKRENPINHTCVPKLITGEITPTDYNKLVELSCMLRDSVCAVFPPYATTIQAGIGKASSIAVENAGKPPTFVTTDDANWQLILAKLGNNDNTTSFGKLLQYIGTLTKCTSDVSTFTNLDLLISITDSFCGYENCLPIMLDALCGVVEPITSNGGQTGVNFKNAGIKADYGIKDLILVKTQKQGATNENSFNTLFDIVTSVDNVPLQIDMTGKTTTQSLIYENASVVFPTNGFITVEGSLGSKFNDGAMRGVLNIKQGSNIVDTIQLFSNSTDGKIDNSYGKKFSKSLPAGNYNLEFSIRFIPNVNISTTENASVYNFNNYVTFNPDL